MSFAALVHVGVLWPNFKNLRAFRKLLVTEFCNCRCLSNSIGGSCCAYDMSCLDFDISAKANMQLAKSEIQSQVRTVLAACGLTSASTPG